MSSSTSGLYCFFCGAAGAGADSDFSPSLVPLQKSIELTRTSGDIFLTPSLLVYSRKVNSPQTKTSLPLVRYCSSEMACFPQIEHLNQFVDFLVPYPIELPTLISSRCDDYFSCGALVFLTAVIWPCAVARALARFSILSPLENL
jgi:hypothetical protein